MPGPMHLDPGRLRVVLDHGEVVELDGGTLALNGKESPSVVLRLAPWRTRICDASYISIFSASKKFGAFSAYLQAASSNEPALASRLKCAPLNRPLLASFCMRSPAHHHHDICTDHRPSVDVIHISTSA